MTFLDIFTKSKNRGKEREEKKLKIIVDKREKNSLIVSELIGLGLDVEFKNLPLGDFIVNKTIVERKTVDDFLSSMINKRLLNQINGLKKYPLKLLIIEGIEEQELYHNDSKINQNAIRGFLLSILLKHKVPILFTKDYRDTSTFLAILAKKQKKDEPIRVKRRTLNKKEILQYILEGFPGIGPKTSKKLLKRFKTLKNVFLAGEELENEIGKKAEVFKLLNEEY